MVMARFAPAGCEEVRTHLPTLASARGGRASSATLAVVRRVRSHPHAGPRLQPPERRRPRHPRAWPGSNSNSGITGVASWAAPSRFDPAKRHGEIAPARGDTMAGFRVESHVANAADQSVHAGRALAVAGSTRLCASGRQSGERPMRPVTFSVVVCVALTVAVAVPDGAAQATSGAALPSDLGVIDFPTSGPPDAQAHFLAARRCSIASASRMRPWSSVRPRPWLRTSPWPTGRGDELQPPPPALPEWDLPRQALERLGPTREARVAKAPTERERGIRPRRGCPVLRRGRGDRSPRRVRG